MSSESDILNKFHDKVSFEVPERDVFVALKKDAAYGMYKKVLGITNGNDTPTRVGKFHWMSGKQKDLWFDHVLDLIKKYLSVEESEDGVSSREKSPVSNQDMNKILSFISKVEVRLDRLEHSSSNLPKIENNTQLPSDVNNRFQFGNGVKMSEKKVDILDSFLYYKDSAFNSLKNDHRFKEMSDLMLSQAVLFRSVISVLTMGELEQEQPMVVFDFLKRIFLVEFHRCRVASSCGISVAEEFKGFFQDKHYSFNSESDLIDKAHGFIQSHMRKKEPKPRKGTEPYKKKNFSKFKCYTCGEQGHISKNCKEKKGEKNEGN